VGGGSESRKSRTKKLESGGGFGEMGLSLHKNPKKETLHNFLRKEKKRYVRGGENRLGRDPGGRGQVNSREMGLGTFYEEKTSTNNTLTERENRATDVG